MSERIKIDTNRQAIGVWAMPMTVSKEFIDSISTENKFQIEGTSTFYYNDLGYPVTIQVSGKEPEIIRNEKNWSFLTNLYIGRFDKDSLILPKEGLFRFDVVHLSREELLHRYKEMQQKATAVESYITSTMPNLSTEEHKRQCILRYRDFEMAKNIDLSNLKNPKNRFSRMFVLECYQLAGPDDFEASFDGKNLIRGTVYDTRFGTMITYADPAWESIFPIHPCDAGFNSSTYMIQAIQEQAKAKNEDLLVTVSYTSNIHAKPLHLKIGNNTYIVKPRKGSPNDEGKIKIRVLSYQEETPGTPRETLDIIEEKDRENVGIYETEGEADTNGYLDIKVASQTKKLRIEKESLETDLKTANAKITSLEQNVQARIAAEIIKSEIKASSEEARANAAEAQVKRKPLQKGVPSGASRLR